MKFVSEQSSEHRDELKQLMKSSSSFRVRQRAHAILLSAKGYSIDQLADIFDADRDTISIWVDTYIAHGAGGLHDAAKSGRPRAVDTPTAAKIVKQVTHAPQQIRQTLSALKKTGHGDQS